MFLHMHVLPIGVSLARSAVKTTAAINIILQDGIRVVLLPFYFREQEHCLRRQLRLLWYLGLFCAVRLVAVAASIYKLYLAPWCWAQSSRNKVRVIESQI